MVDNFHEGGGREPLSGMGCSIQPHHLPFSSSFFNYLYGEKCGVRHGVRKGFLVKEVVTMVDRRKLYDR